MMGGMMVMYASIPATLSVSPPAETAGAETGWVVAFPQLGHAAAPGGTAAPQLAQKPAIRPPGAKSTRTYYLPYGDGKYQIAARSTSTNFTPTRASGSLVDLNCRPPSRWLPLLDRAPSPPSAPAHRLVSTSFDPCTRGPRRWAWRRTRCRPPAHTPGA